MIGEPDRGAWGKINRAVEAFELARGVNPLTDVAEFLPDADDPLFLDILRELARVDLEIEWGSGRRPTADSYLRRFPRLADDPRSMEELRFEEQRQRQAIGGPALLVPANGVATSHNGSSSKRELNPLPELPGREDFADRGLAMTAKPTPEGWAELKASDPKTADRLKAAIANFPKIGSQFLQFKILEEIGRGAFARVYRAEQSELSSRQVVLKVSVDASEESKTLAQLQHTNIVPVYSAHMDNGVEVVCMPYFGSTTLRDVLTALGRMAEFPESGEEFLTTILARGNTTHRSRLLESTPAPSPIARSPTIAGLPRPTGALERIRGLTYVETVLWLSEQLADGLAHAHERGILHCDLKPANILLTDEGRPMLLDFNLSQDTKLRGTSLGARIGGTLPYMAPEHLRAFYDESQEVDARADLFSLGVILYELLAGAPPFMIRQGPTEPLIKQMIADRQSLPRAIRELQPKTPRGVQAIVFRLLASDANQRFSTARELQEELRRQLAHLPLRTVREPMAERLGKWRRRHPRLSSSASVAAFSGVIVASLLWGSWGYRQRLEKLEALQTRDAFEQRVADIRRLLNDPNARSVDIAAGCQQCDAALASYGVSPAAEKRPDLALDALPEPNREEVRREIAETLYLYARAKSKLWSSSPKPATAKEWSSLLRLNQWAIDFAGGENAPQAFWAQRARLWRRLGNEEQERSAAAIASAPRFDSPQDLYLLASERLTEGRPRQAIPLLEETLRLRPNHFWAWVALGMCQDGLQRTDAAIACFSTAIALNQELAWPYVLRGVARLKLRRDAEARSDFDCALRISPVDAEALLHRGMARERLGDLDGAELDFSSAIVADSSAIRGFFLWARIRERRGDPAKANELRQKGWESPATDERAWIARGLARLPDDPDGALADFDRALAMNPNSCAALQNKAHVVSERMGKSQDAIAILDRLLEAYPEYVPALGGRAVLWARVGDRAKAHRDAYAALALCDAPPVRYQIAGAFAHTSRLAPEDEALALAQLRLAIQGGYGRELAAQDKDLDPLRNSPEFQEIIGVTRANPSAAR